MHIAKGDERMPTHEATTIGRTADKREIYLSLRQHYLDQVKGIISAVKQATLAATPQHP